MEIKLSEQEEKALEIIANNRHMVSALTNIFKSVISRDYDLNKNNEDLGADLRANKTASNLLKEGLAEISRHGKKKLDKIKGRNPAI